MDWKKYIVIPRKKPYLHLSVSFIQMLKAGTPAVTMLTMIAFGLEHVRLQLIGTHVHLDGPSPLNVCRNVCI